jgi:hypothetical protein
MPATPPRPAFTAFLAAAVLAVLLAGCATSTTPIQVEPRLQPSVVYIDRMVERAEPQILIRPDNTPAEPPKAMLFPFRVVQSMEYARSAGQELARSFWQIWLNRKVLPVLVYNDAPEVRYPSVNQAMAMAAARGAELAVLGRVANLMDGGTVGDSSLSIQIDIYDVRSGLLVWSIQHGGRMEAGLTHDYILFATKNRMPEDPIWAIMSTVASDMGRPVKAWADGQETR